MLYLNQVKQLSILLERNRKIVKTHNVPSKICVENSGGVFNGIKTEEKK